jgi:hypothetical protein
MCAPFRRDGARTTTDDERASATHAYRMTAFAGHEPPAHEPPAHGIGLNDRVSVPDGRVGSVIGFYSRADATVLVLFDSGDSVEYAPPDLAVEALLKRAVPRFGS